MPDPSKEDLAQMLREYPTWGHAAIAYRDQRDEALRLVEEDREVAENAMAAHQEACLKLDEALLRVAELESELKAHKALATPAAQSIQRTYTASTE